ncbi:hypothetical protein LPLAFNJD_LOCUS2338 [Methylorubrum aminovorans]
MLLRGGGKAGRALVYVASGTGPTPEIAIRSDAEGRFRLALPPGSYVVAARLLDGREGFVEVGTGDKPQDIEIEIPNETGTRVEGEAGEEA